MSYQVLARKWRPKLFKDVVAQNHVTATLKNSIINKKVAHAYLLTGTRGVGKTTLARIFSKALMCPNEENGEPCLKCDVCISIDNNTSMDYLELDGASNNGVSEIREIVDNVQYLPVSSPYKVYVIDEVHMLSTSAFNALLKTLEEPPKHVVFVFATTNPDKLLSTVISRCQKLDLKNVEQDIIFDYLTFISKEEKISFETSDILRAIATFANGSIRDSLSLLDQVISLSTGIQITEEDLSLSLGLAKTSSLDNLILSILACDKNSTLDFFSEILKENVNLKNLGLQILDRLYLILLTSDQREESSKYIPENLKKNLMPNELLWVYETFLKEINEVLISILPSRSFELLLLKLTLRRELLSGEVNSKILVDYKKKNKKIEEPKKLEDLLDKNWFGFVNFVSLRNTMLGLNLEKGNLLGEFFIDSDSTSFKIGFNEDGRIFFDTLMVPENNAKLLDIASQYFQKNKIHIDYKILKKDEIETSKFQTHSDIALKLEQQKLESKKNNLMNNPFVLEAKKLFNSEIKNIHLKEKE